MIIINHKTKRYEIIEDENFNKCKPLFVKSEKIICVDMYTNENNNMYIYFEILKDKIYLR